jgi:hypothetical protein
MLARSVGEIAISRPASRHAVGSTPLLDEEACARLLASVRSTEEQGWRELVALLWPVVAWLVRTSRAMAVLARSDDHVRNATLLVMERLGKNGCKAARLQRPWGDAHPDKTLVDWLRIVSANVARDYVRERAGRAGAALDKRLVGSLATLLPDEDDLPRGADLSSTSAHAARELVRWAEGNLPSDQLAALGAWLDGEDFGAMAASLAVADAAAAQRLVRAALATLRRHARAA